MDDDSGMNISCDQEDEDDDVDVDDVDVDVDMDVDQTVRSHLVAEAGEDDISL